MSKILELAKRIASTGGLETKTTETISGTYDSAGQQRLLSHAYTIGADLTITNGELILSRLADNGTGMTVEFGSDVTLSGDGTLMLGDLGQGQQNLDASKLTGVLGSGVTIPAAGVTGTLNSEVLPTGSILQVLSVWTDQHYTDTIGAGDNYFAENFFKIEIIPKQSGSWFKCTCMWAGYIHAPRDAGMSVQRNGTTFNQGNTSYTNNPMMPCSMGPDSDYSGAGLTCIGTTIDKVANAVKGTAIIYELVANHESGGKQMHTNRLKDGGTDEVYSSEFIVEEIAG